LRSLKEECASCEEVSLRNGLMLGMCACYFGGVYEAVVLMAWLFLRGAVCLME